MKRSIGTDHGLTLRMFFTMLLLAVLYLVFVGVLLRVGVPVAGIVVIAVVLLGVQYAFSDKLILATLGAREVTESEAPQLHATVQRLAQMTDIPMPKVAIIQSRVPNALATGRNPKHALVAVTTGILEQLEPREMEAVLAHELSHVIHRDMRVMAMASFFATIAAFIVQSSLWFGGGLGYGGGYGGRGRGQSSEGGSFILIVLVAAVVWAISFVLIRTLSRYREYAADRGSAVITQEPALLASALLKISGRMERIPSQDLRQMQTANALMFVPASVKGSLAEVFSTHPSVEHRVLRLQELERRLSH